ncbi:non-homologous end joining protein Ku [Edaphobacter flagellatus]|uniref:non-homologous end joining protein Ku n=1 Tax=Edaphobacter flagellatus TaxID=1933044 RepID=UPI0021B23D22|nr:Ku protein [Edaphobacter flagellatus]
MARPYWSGQIQISLVSFGIKLFVATESKSEIRFHQISRSTGERVRHQKVLASSLEENPGEAANPVEKDEIVKGYEYRKGEYVIVEPKELEQLRVPSKHSISITQFVGIDEIGPEYMEKPYFIVPEDDVQAEAFAVVRTALKKTKKMALGKIAFGGREHVFAITAAEDDNLGGMMGYTMRYQEELRNPAEYFKDIKKVPVNADSLELAMELIKRKAAKFEPDAFKDEYESAVRELVEAKIKHLPIPQDEVAPRQGKVVNLMDALRKSVGEPAEEPAPKKPASSVKSKASAKDGIALVKPGKSAGKRKSA